MSLNYKLDHVVKFIIGSYSCLAEFDGDAPCMAGDPALSMPPPAGFGWMGGREVAGAAGAIHRR